PDPARERVRRRRRGAARPGIRCRRSAEEAAVGTPVGDQPCSHTVSLNFSLQGASMRHTSATLSALGTWRHACAFFHSADEEYRALLPFIKEGLECGDKMVHSLDPERCEEHVERLMSAGIDGAAMCQAGRLELRSWAETHLRDGEFDQDRTLGVFGEIAADAKRQGFPQVRFVSHMEWALEGKCGMVDLLEYEAKANDVRLHQTTPLNPVICAYDLTRFSGLVVIDILRTHPLVIIDGVPRENPFFVPPEEFLREIHERRSSQC